MKNPCSTWQVHWGTKSANYQAFFLIYHKWEKRLYSFAQIFGRILKTRFFIDRVEMQQAHSSSSMNSPALKTDLHKSFLLRDKNVFLSWKLMQKSNRFLSVKERSMNFHCPHGKENRVQSTKVVG